MSGLDSGDEGTCMAFRVVPCFKPLALSWSGIGSVSSISNGDPYGIGTSVVAMHPYRAKHKLSAPKDPAPTQKVEPAPQNKTSPKPDAN